MSDDRNEEAMSDNETYHARPEFSNSDASILAKPNGPQLFKAIKIDRTMRSEPTEAMDLGSMVHTDSLEPHTFWDRYVYAMEGLNRVSTAGKIAYLCFEENRSLGELYAMKPEGINRRTKLGREEYAAFLEIAGDRKVISNDDWDTAQAYLDFLNVNKEAKRTIVKPEDVAKAKRCSEALKSHNQIGELLRIPDAMIEKEFYFEWLGVPCRSKLDWCHLDASVILDIKTCQDASPAFNRTMWDRGYHRQAAFYRQAVLAMTGVECRFLFACVDTNKPHSVGLYEPDNDTLSRGHEECEALLIEYQTRYESGDWLQEWSKGIVPIGLPAYARKL